MLLLDLLEGAFEVWSQTAKHGYDALNLVINEASEGNEGIGLGIVRGAVISHGSLLDFGMLLRRWQTEDARLQRGVQLSDLEGDNYAGQSR